MEILIFRECEPVQLDKMERWDSYYMEWQEYEPDFLNLYYLLFGENDPNLAPF